jgi:acetyltransferase-like isoleucine patch superfamily enzyme
MGKNVKEGAFHGEIDNGAIPVTGLRAKLQRLIHTKVWGMDIHPTARIEPSALIDRTWPRGVHIGEDTHIAEQAVVLTHDFTRGLYLDTRIGARCHLGPRAIVFPGVSIGDDCIVMPGALVNKDMPSNSLAVGNPAQIHSRSDGVTVAD